MFCIIEAEADFEEAARALERRIAQAHSCSRRASIIPHVRIHKRGVCSLRVWSVTQVIRRNLGVCHAEAARHRHAPGGLLTTSATLESSDCAIRTDLHSLFTSCSLPQSGTSLALQHKMADSRLLATVHDEDEGDIGIVIVCGVGSIGFKSKFEPMIFALVVL